MYLTDVLRLLGENAAMLTKGSYVTVRWADLDKQKEDERSAEEIALDVIRKAGLTAKEGE